jgi:hypothetical protein
MGGGPVTCVYHVYDGDQLVATGRLTLDTEPQVGSEVRLNGRVHVVREVGFREGMPLVTLESR